MQHLRRLYPYAAEMATSLGGVKVPVRAEQGTSAVVCGFGSLAEVRRHFRAEGQALFPVPVAELGEQNDAGEDLTMSFGNFTPVMLTATRWHGGCFGAYDEISLSFLTTYARMAPDESLRKHPFLHPFLLTHDPAVRAYPLLTVTTSADVNAVNREVYHLPSIHDPDLKVDTASDAPHAPVTRVAWASKDAAAAHLMGSSWDVTLSTQRESLSAKKEKLLDIQRTVGWENVFKQRYEARRRWKMTIPHGRSTVLPGHRARNDVHGHRGTPGVISGVQMDAHAAPCGADCDIVFRNTGSQSARVWNPEIGDAATLTGSALAFDPCLTIHTAGIDAVRLLPQRPVLPLHSSDQKQGELRALAQECQTLLDARRMEQPDEFYLPPNVVDVHKGDQVHQGASWGMGGSGRA